MGKKIGIMTMQRIINYGSFLQAYALKSFIEELGFNNIEFIDYKFETSFVKEKKESIIKKIKKNKNPYNYIVKKHFIKKLNHEYINELKKIGITDKNYNTNVDILIIGSDEVFNCIQPFPVGYSKNLFGKGYENSQVISYAASFGSTTYDKLVINNIDREISNMLKKFEFISVRDKNSKDIVNRLTGRSALLNLDPVLIYSFNNEKKKYKINMKNYIILYAYTDRLSSEEEKYIKKFAKKIDKKIISIGNYSRIADQNIVCSPLYVFSYFENADYIITDTFHGTVFSIKMNSKFCTIIRDSNKNKLEYLLTCLGRSDRIVKSLQDIDKLYYKKINYENTNKIIETEIEKSTHYLKECLNYEE